MDFDRIIASTPVNRAAAVVAKGSNVDAPLTPLQKRENLVRLVQQIDKAIQQAKEPERKKYLGLKKLEVQNALKALPRKVPVGCRDLGSWFMDVAKERLSKSQFTMMVAEAVKRSKAAREQSET